MLAARQGYGASLQCGRTRLPARTRHTPTCAAAKSVSLVKLQVPFETDFGDSVAVVTSKNWKDPVHLKWKDGNVWAGELEAEAGLVEYKYVLLRGGKIREWQPGANLAVDVPGEAAVVYVDDMWLNEDRLVRLDGDAPSDGTPTGDPPVDAARETALDPDAADPSPTPSAPAGGARRSSRRAALANARSSSRWAALADGNPETGGGGGAVPRGGLDGPDPPSLQALTVVELKHLLKQHKLTTTGRKADLIARLNKHCITDENFAEDDS